MILCVSFFEKHLVLIKKYLDIWIIFWFIGTQKWNTWPWKDPLKHRVNGALILQPSESGSEKKYRYYLNQLIYCGTTWPPCLPVEAAAERAAAFSEGYDDAEEVPVPKAPSASQMSEEEVPTEENGLRAFQTGEWD